MLVIADGGHHRPIASMRQCSVCIVQEVKTARIIILPCTSIHALIRARLLERLHAKFCNSPPAVNAARAARQLLVAMASNPSSGTTFLRKAVMLLHGMHMSI